MLFHSCLFWIFALLTLYCDTSEQYWKAKTIDGFITHVVHALDYALRSRIPRCRLYDKYSITDSKLIGNTSIRLFRHLIKVRIDITPFKVRGTIESCISFPTYRKYSPDNFELSLDFLSGHASIYNTQFDPDLSDSVLTPKQTMVFIDYILSRMGMLEISIFNTARQYYVHRGDVKWITTIELRCISGKTTDWFSDFGYFNNHRDEIADEMKRIHNFQIKCGPYYARRNVSLGPLLLGFWIGAGCTEFHDVYVRFSRLFEKLVALRRGKWIKDIEPCSGCSTPRQIKSPLPEICPTPRAFSTFPERKPKRNQANYTLTPRTASVKLPRIPGKPRQSGTRRNNPLNIESRPDTGCSITSLSPW